MFSTKIREYKSTPLKTNFTHKNHWQKIIMQKSLLSFAVIAASAPLIASASLSGNELVAANTYFASHPDIQIYAPWIKQSVLDANSLTQANYLLHGNSYYDQKSNTVIYTDPIVPVSSPSGQNNTVLVSQTAINGANNSQQQNGQQTQIVTPSISGTDYRNAVNDMQAAARQQTPALPQTQTQKAIPSISGTGYRNMVNDMQAAARQKTPTLPQTLTQTQTATPSIVGTTQGHNEQTNTPSVTNYYVVSAVNVQQDNTLVAQYFADSNQQAKAVADNASQYTDQQISKLDSTVQDNRKRASGGIAGAIALTQIPHVDGDFMSVGAGVGTFDGEQAIAIGSKQQWSSHVATQIGATWSSAGGAGTGAGIAIGLGN
ncbi:hypothetical protein F9U43_15945 [Pectobacterium versatile]|nr:hypothetical protein [Pectobacterium versatile]